MTTVEFEYSYEQRDRGWPENPAVAPLKKLFDVHEAEFRETLSKISAFNDHFSQITNEEPASSIEPFWTNPWFPPLDAIALTGLLAIHRPERYIEVGSGNSTKFAKWIIERLDLPTEIVSIDPNPREEIDAICDVTIRSPLELADQRVFHDLKPNDLVFIDNSHRSFPSSDVTVFFIEILPSLPKGVVFGLHDIFLPFDYPMSWNDRFYNEQYLLACYLLGGAGSSQMLLATHYMQRLRGETCATMFPFIKAPATINGGSLFMRR